MKKKILLFIIFCITLFISPVYAQNNVDYTLTITYDYKFKEVIKYEIGDYKQIENGYNVFADIVTDDVEVDIFGKSKYQKQKEFKNNKYYVTLSYTYSEYSISNSIFLNDCFENENYKYDINGYSFSGSGGFYCLRGDSLKITIITDFDVASSNAQVIGNKYIWNPVDNNFDMNININKKYNESDITSESTNIDDTGKEEFDSANNSTNEDIENNALEDENLEAEEITKPDNNEKNNITIVTFIVLGVVIAIVSAIVIIILKAKKNDLDKI